MKTKLLQLSLFVIFLLDQSYVVTRTLISQEPLPNPIAASDLRVLSLGEPAIAAKLLSYWLLSYDTQQGQVIPFEDINYKRLAGWLDTIQSLDPLSDDATMAAAGVFIDVKDRSRQLMMIEFVRRQFLKNPKRHWRWMVQIVMLAKYRMQDMSLALELAKELRTASAGTSIPFWAQEMEVYLLHDMGQLEAAIALIDAMIKDGVITDADELRFLTRRIQQLEQAKNSR